MQTDYQEAKEFVFSYLLSWKMAVYLILAICVFYLINRFLGGGGIDNLLKSITCRFIGLLIVILGFALPYATPPGFAQADNSIIKLWNSWKFVKDSHSDIDNYIKMIDMIKINPYSNKDAPTIILVIGESYNKHHSQLYGYDHVTSPKLSEERNLIVFDNAMTPVCFTNRAMKYIFTLDGCGLRSDESTLKYVLFPAVFKKAGFKVGYFDNQYTRSQAGTVDYSCCYFLSPNYISENCFNVRNSTIERYDGDFVNKYKHSFFKGVNALNIIHLKGQHSDASNRYPKAFSIFRCSDIQRNDLNESERQKIAEYDNATRYNDTVLEMIIDEFRNQDAVLVYLSDHGDNIYDGPSHRYGRNVGNLIDEESINNIRQIPFIIWCSDLYICKRPDKYSSIKNSSHQPVCLDDVAYLLFDLGGVNTNYSDSTRSVINSSYKPHRTALK